MLGHTSSMYCDDGVQDGSGLGQWSRVGVKFGYVETLMIVGVHATIASI